MATTQRLSGVRVHLSGSNNEMREDIADFVQKFAAKIFSEGGSIVHGSHPSFIEPLRKAAESFIRAGGTKGALTLVRAKSYSIDEYTAEIEEQRAFASVEIVPADNSDDQAADGLTPMRDWMAERSDVVICVGGAWWDVNKVKAGVPNELDTMLDLGKPGFVVAGFGGAIAGYLEEDPSLLSRLRNGLSHEANAMIANSTSVEQVVGLISSQLKNLPLTRRNISRGRNFRILALDGGGLRGTFTAAVLAKWDDMLKAGGGNDLIAHFDLVAGTSTGAILAIGLAMGLTPREILEFYKENGPQIFPKDRKLRHWLKSKHDSATLRGLLTDVFGDKTLEADSRCRLVIPTVRAKHGQAESISTPHSPDRTAFRGISAVDAALASSAAPTYFDEVTIDGPVALETFLDGGVWANNPILPALAEAVRYLKIPLDRIDVLSIGTLSSESDFTEQLGKGKAGWAPHSVDLFFAAQEHGALVLAESFLGPTRHVRVNQQTPNEIKLDDAEAFQEMVQRGNDVGKDHFVEVRSRFFDGQHVEPWERY
ncbi:TPA: patatin-like phospholipase family protein [Vibrio parahaemolyticus]|uniref:CBASS cGAMP-activated phospholipase n=1 Tax=Vibrio harveyi group TaxID=717610 RepID=UPI0003A7C9FF|nr:MULTISPECIES: CBASS cGAMP-activated phospholipase [Vibrio harveyi group]MCR9820021.1 patatin-like phospholipase family protein [Vibrio parahaemolyticus]HBC3930629.1 patatin-like phospholipase family protein [Vibrio parahaemolyticus]